MVYVSVLNKKDTYLIAIAAKTISMFKRERTERIIFSKFEKLRKEWYLMLISFLSKGCFHGTVISTSEDGQVACSDS